MGAVVVNLLLSVYLLKISGAILNGGTIYSGGLPSVTPKFISRGNTFKVVLGDSVTLPCEVQDLGAFVIVWKKGLTLLSAGQQMITRDPRFSLSGYNLHVRDISHADQGDYTCQIGDGTPGDLIHTVEILMPPSIQILPPNGQTTARKGGTVTFECRANGNPPPVVQWSKKDGLLPSGIQIQTGYVLTINDVQRQHGGVYHCTASNGIGQPVTGEIGLHVLYPPEVNVLRSWVNSGEGLEAKLDCMVHADPPAEYIDTFRDTWWNEEVKDPANIFKLAVKSLTSITYQVSQKVLWYQDSFLIQPTDRRIMSSSGKTHTLTIRNVQLSDFGNYSCVVVNSIGREKKYIELSGKPGPPIVTSSGYSNPHEYNLTWVVQSVFPIIEVRILYRRMLINSTYHHPGQWHDLLIRAPQLYNPATSERHQWYLITNLMAESVYECLVQAKNQHGFGELSDPHQWFSSQRGRLLHSGGDGVAQINTFLVIVMICSFLLQ